MLSGKSDGYLVPGVEAKLSARLSAGDSNLMAGVEFMTASMCGTLGDIHDGEVS